MTLLKILLLVSALLSPLMPTGHHLSVYCRPDMSSCWIEVDAG